MKHIGPAILILYGLLTANAMANASEAMVPEPFRGFDSASSYMINYDDLTDLLSTVVADVGPSTREVADLPEAKTGTRMKPKVQRLTANEGNRFYFQAFHDNEASQQFLRDLQASLEQVPDDIPLEKFSREEQLAYWLNLYNVTVLNEVIAVYPKRNLKKLFQGKKSILSKKLLTVAGVPLSLDDIQHTILKQNYDNNPLVMYGLYQGIVGGPNIRKTAYTGADVFFALEENAYEFINSNRGTFIRADEDTLRVSSLYERNRGYFPEFDEQLPEHLLEYLEEGVERNKVQMVSSIKPDIDDWTVTDLGGNRHEIGGSFADNNAAMLDAYKGPRRRDGGIMVASVEVKRTKKKDDEEEDVTLEDLGEYPLGQGARPEEITTGEIVSSPESPE